MTFWGQIGVIFGANVTEGSKQYHLSLKSGCEVGRVTPFLKLFGSSAETFQEFIPILRKLLLRFHSKLVSFEGIEPKVGR